MRIADIISTYADPSAQIVDRTAPASKLSSYLRLPGPSELEVVTDGRAERRFVVAELVRSAVSDPTLLSRLIDAGGASDSSVYLLFADHVDAFVAHGVVEGASQNRLELVSVHATDHRVFTHAAVLRPSDREPSDLRLRSEYRLTRYLLGDRESQLAAMRARIDELEDAPQAVRTLRASLTQSNRERDLARDDLKAERRRSEALEKHLDLTRKRMVSARSSVGFRLGRASKLAWKKRKKPLAVPKRWLEAFREDAKLPPDYPEFRVPADSDRRDRLDPATEAVARENFLLDLPPLAKAPPGIAGIAGPELAAELDAAARFRPLSPNAWRFLLEQERPALVLVTADGLAPNTAWGSFGSVGGRGWADALGLLGQKCAEQRIPIVYWDTIGDSAYRLRLPRDVRFDAIFSVNPDHAGQSIDDSLPGVEFLAPCVEPSVYSPLGLPPIEPTGSAFFGEFDRRRGSQHIGRIEMLLDAAISAGPLEIFDPHHGDVGPGSEALEFPTRFARHSQLSPRPRDVATRLRELGVAIVGARPLGGTPDWGVLRAIASGAHVISTEATNDGELSTAITTVVDQDAAIAAIRHAMTTPRLGESWERAFARLLDRFTLRRRLGEICHRVGAASVAGPEPTLGVLGRVDSSEQLDRLRDFLASQTVAPTSLHLVAGDGVDVAAGLAGAIGPTRLTVVSPSHEPDGATGAATHFVCWHPDVASGPSATSDLLSLARMSDEPVVGLTDPHSAAATYDYGEVGSNSLVAVRGADADRLSWVARNPKEAAEMMRASGTKVLAKRRRLR